MGYEEEFDWEEIEKEIENAEEFTDDEGNRRKEIFLGTVFSLTPSGKYYTPYANSNVTEEEAAKDEEWWKDIENECEKRNLYITSGEGDPCDIIIGKVL